MTMPTIAPVDSFAELGVDALPATPVSPEFESGPDVLVVGPEDIDVVGELEVVGFAEDVLGVIIEDGDDDDVVVVEVTIAVTAA